MTKRLSIALMMCVALTLLVAPALAGALQNVSVGQDVFIGEQGLNLIGISSGQVLAYYTGSQTVGSSAPAATVTVGNAGNFYVSPSDFVGRTGNWYLGTGSQTVGLVVNDPSQTVSIYDQQSGKDVTGKSVPGGDYLIFRMETNLNVIPTERGSGTTGFMTIKVKSSDGTVYTGLQQSETITQTLLNQYPNSMPYYWNSIPLSLGSKQGWATGILGTQGERIYKAGGYTFWTECNLNGMKDNYKDASGNDYTGKTVSSVRTITIASDTVKIEASKDSVVRGNPFAVTITGKPNSAYYLWLKGTGSMSGNALDEPPSMVLSQDNVVMDPINGPWPIGQYVYQGSTKTIQSDVPQYYGIQDVNGTYYYALVTLSNSGTRTVGFQTSKDTKDKKYTVRVERPDPYDPPTSNTGSSRQFKSDEVDISVQKGAVTVVAAGTQNYFLGEEVKFTGTNSETDFTYLFITGPNLPSNGGQMTDPRKAVNTLLPSTFQPSDVLEDNTWEYKWQTSNLNIDAGTYTVYAVATPSDKSMLSDTQYATVSVIIRKPFISAQASQSVVAAGDKLYIRGTAAGQPTQGIAVWILGKNKVIYDTTSVNADGTFEKEISQGTTADLAAGQYFVVAQHPMYNEIFDVYPASSVAGENNQDIVAGSYPVAGNTLFKLQGAGSLQGSDAAEALVQALNNPSVDDTYAKLQFLVEVPKITVLPVGEKQVGDKFTISGTTNLAVDDELLVEVTSSSFKPTEKTQSGEFSGATGTVKVQKGTDGLNKWSFPVDAAAFKPDEYIVQASGITVNAQTSTLFNVVEFKPTTVPTTVVTTAPVVTSAPATVVPVTTVPTAKPTTQPGFGALIALIGLGAVAFLVVRKH
jgi:trimeric autotransporter adhesin